MKSRSVYLFGLSVRSDIPLPGLDLGEEANPDVVIRLGEVEKQAGPLREVAADAHGATLTIEGVARYRISDGSRIIVQPEPGAPEANVRLFLLGSAMGLLLHQRGLLPLHASAVEIDGRAVAFTGSSGTGKSTLAAAFHDRGHRAIADDVCVIGFDDEGEAFARPGIPRMRLWEETLVATGRSSAGYEPSYAGDESFRKFDVPIDVGWGGSAPIAAVVHLCAGEALELRRIAGSEAADMIFANTYRGEYVRLAGHPPSHWQGVMQLIRGVPVFELSRPRDLARLGGHADRICEVLRRADPKAG